MISTGSPLDSRTNIPVVVEGRVESPRTHGSATNVQTVTTDSQSPSKANKRRRRKRRALLPVKHSKFYPGVCCGHHDCIQYPVTTPKTMGWLWSLSETGGVKVKIDIIVVYVQLNRFRHSRNIGFTQRSNILHIMRNNFCPINYLTFFSNYYYLLILQYISTPLR